MLCYSEGKYHLKTKTAAACREYFCILQASGNFYMARVTSRRTFQNVAPPLCITTDNSFPMYFASFDS